MRFILVLILLSLYTVSFAQVHVRGYYRSNGTYVRPHERTRPNNTVTDNYSYPGNYNPNKGQITQDAGSNPIPVVQSSKVSERHKGKTRTVSESVIHENSVTTYKAPETTTTPVPVYAEMEANAALKVQPSYTANSTYAIPKGSVVRVAKYDENYYRAEVNGRIGYVCTCQVKKTFTK